MDERREVCVDVEAEERLLKAAVRVSECGHVRDIEADVRAERVAERHQRADTRDYAECRNAHVEERVSAAICRFHFF